ncbi:MAG: (d)CMP kinase [Bacteroidetes bacterium]|nr:(d)CMP kinase [Bacteroidota bacterium]MDA0950898.1 (d)CMP kinase [Bacteroidota bacterium]
MVLGPIHIAIDGYSSTGKSTLAKALAKELGYLYIDSGAMYRAVTWYLIQHHIAIDQIEEVLDDIRVDFDQLQRICLNGEVVEKEIRQMEVSEKVSEVAKVAAVRKKLVEQQQGFNQSVVMDGRDIGTVVFPSAQLKLFMTASPEVRVQRRYNELQQQLSSITLEQVRANLQMRDYEDEHREVDPLKMASDAVVLDNSNLSQEEQLQWVLRLLQEKLNITV